MRKTDFLQLSYYGIAIILFANIALLNRNIVNIANSQKSSSKVLGAKVSAVTDTVSIIREQHIPFGQGSIVGEGWQDVTGLELTLDSQNYKYAKKIFFDATFQIPTGNGQAYVRLYNVTDKVQVWQSEISSQGPAGTVFYQTSPPFTLATGVKTYQVQMKNTLSYTTLLHQSRIRVLY